jgi:hypothetical protein
MFGCFAPLQGCGSGSQNTSLLLNIVILLITRAAGGIVKDNNTTLTIPPDSLQADTTIRIQPAASLPASPAGLYLIPGTAYTYGPAGTTFSPPATLTETFSPASIPNYVSVDTIGLYVVSGDTYTRVAGSPADLLTDTVTATIDSLGTYVLMGIKPIQDPM